MPKNIKIKIKYVLNKLLKKLIIGIIIKPNTAYKYEIKNIIQNYKMPKSSNSKPRKSTARKGAKKSAPAAAPVVVAAPEPVVVEPVVVEAAAPEPVVAESASESPTLDDQFKDIVERITQFRSLATTLLADVKRLQKNVGKHVRESNKKQRKRRGATNADGVKRPPSGFAKPAKISDALCSFLGQPSGTEMARTEVTKYLTKYIKEHQLQDPSNRRIINCDAQLSGLLNVKPTDEVTYFNLQRYMKPHFPPKNVSTVSA